MDKVFSHCTEKFTVKAPSPHKKKRGPKEDRVFHLKVKVV
tara:strand:- start:372 stop:491 length:120 start_codon:yes stop_codon:yes gene_type:complete